MDARVPTASIFEAFGVSVSSLIRPGPDDGVVTTVGVWIPLPLDEGDPFGTALSKRDPRKVIAIGRSSALDSLPRGTTFMAPEEEGGVAVPWRVENYAGVVEPDLMRVIVVPVSEVLS